MSLPLQLAFAVVDPTGLLGWNPHVGSDANVIDQLLPVGAGGSIVEPEPADWHGQIMDVGIIQHPGRVLAQQDDRFTEQ